VGGGTLSNFAGSGALYTASFAPAANSTAPATIEVAPGTFTDDTGTANILAAQLSMSVDTVAPGITLATNDAALKTGDVALLTFTLTEPSTDFTTADIAVIGGTLSGFSGSGSSYTANFTPAAWSLDASVNGRS